MSDQNTTLMKCLFHGGQARQVASGRLHVTAPSLPRGLKRPASEPSSSTERALARCHLQSPPWGPSLTLSHMAVQVCMLLVGCALGRPGQDS